MITPAVAATVRPWSAYGRVALFWGECLDVLQSIRTDSIDGGVLDPPYGIRFMREPWDCFSQTLAQARVTANRAIDSDNPNLRGRTRGPASSPSSVQYDYSRAGLLRFQAWVTTWATEVLRVLKPGAHLVVCGAPRSAHRMVCGLEDAGFEIRDSFAWLFGQGMPKSHNFREGLGTGLKPGHEPITLARKPFKGTVRACVAQWGTGALNIRAAELSADGNTTKANRARGHRRRPQHYSMGTAYGPTLTSDRGRWPANVLLDAVAAELLDLQAGDLLSGANQTQRSVEKFQRIFQRFQGQATCVRRRGADQGGASRFYYVAKPSRAERDFGLDSLNLHPTVKPVALMRWLIRLMVPPGGVVLDAFLGSGTSGMAALLEDRMFLGIERERPYLAQADRRIRAVHRELQALQVVA